MAVCRSTFADASGSVEGFTATPMDLNASPNRFVIMSVFESSMWILRRLILSGPSRFDLRGRLIEGYASRIQRFTSVGPQTQGGSGREVLARRGTDPKTASVAVKLSTRYIGPPPPAESWRLGSRGKRGPPRARPGERGGGVRGC